MKKIFFFLLIIFTQNIFAQDVDYIDNKGVKHTGKRYDSATISAGLTNKPDTLYWFHAGISNAENQAVAGDTAYQRNWTPDSRIQVLVSTSWVTASRYTNNIAGGSVVRENSVVVAAQRYLLDHPNTVIRIMYDATSNLPLYEWSPATTGFGEKSTSNTKWTSMNAKLDNFATASPGKMLDAIFWQVGENDNVDTTENSFWYKMKAIDSALKLRSNVSPNLQMIFSSCMPIYNRMQRTFDSLANGQIDIGTKRWKVVRHAFISGVDAAHLNNYQQNVLGVRFYEAYVNYFSPLVNNQITIRSNGFDTTLILKAPPTGFSTAITIGSTVRISMNTEVSGNLALSGDLISSQPIRDYTTSTTGGQFKGATTSGTSNVPIGIDFYQGGFTSVAAASFSGFGDGTGGGFTIRVGTGTSAFSKTSMWGDRAGRVAIGSTAPDASAALDVQSTTAGLGIPSMTSTQASAISSPRNGLVVYVTDTNGTFTAIGIWARVNGAWTQL